MAKILCLDYGMVRIGVAISDLSQTIATSYDFINAKKGKTFDKIKNLIHEHQCEKVVIGLPLSLNGQDTQKTLQVRAFAEKLQEAINKPVILWDERLTTYEAENILISQNVKWDKRKKLKDSLSAQLILQDYLDQQGD